jgi:hypothetical protein
MNRDSLRRPSMRATPPRQGCLVGNTPRPLADSAAIRGRTPQPAGGLENPSHVTRLLRIGPAASTATVSWLPTTYTWSKHFPGLDSLLGSPSRSCDERRDRTSVYDEWNRQSGRARRDRKGEDPVVRRRAGPDRARDKRSVALAIARPAPGSNLASLVPGLSMALQLQATRVIVDATATALWRRRDASRAYESLRARTRRACRSLGFLASGGRPEGTPEARSERKCEHARQRPRAICGGYRRATEWASTCCGVSADANPVSRQRVATPSASAARKRASARLALALEFGKYERERTSPVRGFCRESDDG